jgi:hypothetical protein
MTKPASKPADGPGPRPLLPVHAAEHGRRKLRDGGKGNQADTDQRIGFTGRPK